MLKLLQENMVHKIKIICAVQLIPCVIKVLVSDAFKLLFVLSLKIYFLQTKLIAKFFMKVFSYTGLDGNLIFVKLFNLKMFPDKRFCGENL